MADGLKSKKHTQPRADERAHISLSQPDKSVASDPPQSLHARRMPHSSVQDGPGFSSTSWIFHGIRSSAGSPSLDESYRPLRKPGRLRSGWKSHLRTSYHRRCDRSRRNDVDAPGHRPCPGQDVQTCPPAARTVTPNRAVFQHCPRRSLPPRRENAGVMSTEAVRAGEHPPNPAKFLDFSLHLRKRARAPVIMPQPREFKLLTTTGFS